MRVLEHICAVRQETDSDQRGCYPEVTFNHTINISGLLRLEKGICHVDKYIRFPKSNPDAARAPHRADHYPGNRPDDWFHLDPDRSRHCTSGLETDRCLLAFFRLPLSCFSTSVEFLMLYIRTVSKGESNE